MLIKRIVSFFTSLKLTVVLLAFGIALVFLGTLAQVDEGLYQAQSHYFRQWVVLGLDLFGKKIPLLLPGGYLIGTLLLVNLLSAHIYRFKFSIKKTGIFLTHAGVILLLVGQLVTDMFAHETQMFLTEGESKSYSESSSDYELVFDYDSDEMTIPARMLKTGGQLKFDNLPFEIHVLDYWKNTDVPSFRAPMMSNAPPIVPNGVANDFDFAPLQESKTTDDKNVPTALVELVGSGRSLGKWVVSDWISDESMINAEHNLLVQQYGPQMAQMIPVIMAKFTPPQSIAVNGTRYTLKLQPQRVRYPFTLTLLGETHSIYPGTATAENPQGVPKDFRSQVRLQNPKTGESREVQIYMNSPLRYAGMTFYQYQMTAGDLVSRSGQIQSSVLEVVRNPGWLTPYFGCGLVALGLVTQFLMHLTGFITKRRTK